MVLEGGVLTDSVFTPPSSSPHTVPSALYHRSPHTSRHNSMASPTPSQSDTLTSTSNSSDGEMEQHNLQNGLTNGGQSGLHSLQNGTPNGRCTLCSEVYTCPKVLYCFHTFCQPCLEKIQDVNTPDRVTCPECHQDTTLPARGINGLMPDFNTNGVNADDEDSLTCTGCKSKETGAVARCLDCNNFLCPNCVMAHQFMHCFEGHRVVMFSDLQNADNVKDEIKFEKSVNCPKHRNELLTYFCRSCNVAICHECTLSEHARGHDVGFIEEIGQKQVEMLQRLADEARLKTGDLRGTQKNLEMHSSRMQMMFNKAQNEINDTYNFYRTMLEERRSETLKELETAYNSKTVLLDSLNLKVNEAIDKLYQGSDFIDKLLKHSSSSEILMFKKMIDAKVQSILSFVPDVNEPQSSFELEFVSNFQAIQVGVRNTFGYVRHGAEVQQNKPQPIARPTNGFSQSKFAPQNFGPLPTSNGPYGEFGLTKRYDSNQSLVNMGVPSLNANTAIAPGMYGKWSSGTSTGIDLIPNGDIFQPQNDSIMDLTSKLISANIYPPKSQIKRQKMIYHCKFGEFGVMDGQFTEPSGVAVNAQNDIIVADTNNHRIQIFDKEGRFKFQFGECGKRDGQLLYPNRVAVVKTSGDIIVTERSPTHQIQIYNHYGQFVRKFGANVLQHPRGVTVDNKGRIIIVECKVMRVIIFDQMGNVLQKFGCSKHLEFPNGVVVNDKEEIFISDNRAHCVKVFSYRGEFLRQIGGEGITNYPIGVGINSNQEILIADNHNNFNLTIFTQDGVLLSALESKVKHAQCFDVALMDDGSIVLASKDYRLYVYRYIQLPALGI